MLTVVYGKRHKKTAFDEVTVCTVVLDSFERTSQCDLKHSRSVEVYQHRCLALQDLLLKKLERVS